MTIQYNYAMPVPKNGNFTPLHHAIIRKNKDESVLDFVSRAMRHVHNHTWHCHISQTNISYLDNFILQVMSEVIGEKIMHEGILDPGRFLCGFCSQRVFMLMNILDQYDIETIPFFLDGHVVLKVHYKGHEYIADPDYGVNLFRYDLEKKDYEKVVVDRYKKPSMRKTLLQKEKHGPFERADVMRRLMVIQRRAFNIADLFALACLFFGPIAFLLISRLKL